MNKKALYFRNIFIWKRAFGKPLSSYCAYYGSCARCEKRASHRHHKAHDYIFACAVPSEFAKRYIAFVRKDFDFLCAKCHQNCHKIYHELIKEFNKERRKLQTKLASIELIIKLCYKYKKLFLKRYNKWLNWGKK